jgi:serine/threonine protein kinase
VALLAPPVENSGRATPPDTVVIKRVDTVVLHSRLSPETNGESVAGYQLLTCTHQTPFTEVWKAQAPAGNLRLIKIIFGSVAGARNPRAESRLSPLSQFRHPGLVGLEILQESPGRLVLASDLCEKTLRDRFQECQAQGLPGIPRQELLGYLRAAAETLGDLFAKHSVQHLGLNPRNLALDGGRLRLADFGIVQLVLLPSGKTGAQVNPRYSAPELFQQGISPTCDQYSLALIYHEMLTGSPPGPAGTRPLKRLGSPPGSALNLDRLPPADRDVIGCALNSNPQRRWKDAVEMVEALEAVSGARIHEVGDPAGIHLAPSLPSEGGAEASPVPKNSDLPQARFSTQLPQGVIRLRLEAFRQQWSGQVVRDDQTDLVYRLQTPSTVWQRWLGRSSGVDVHCRWETSGPGADLVVRIHPPSSGRKPSPDLLRVLGPLLLESLRTFLQVNPKRRSHERVAWPHPVQAQPVGPDGTLGPPVACRGKDISLHGVGFYIPAGAEIKPGPGGAEQFRLHLPRTLQTPEMAVPVRVVRVWAGEDGWCEVGAVLLPPEEGEASRG